jgi:polysaccharide export outer membrane protein
MNNTWWKLFFLFVIPVFLSAQLTDKTERSTFGTNATPSSSLQQMSQQSLRTPIQDGPVDPKEYIVGPGDVFSVNIWAATPLSFQVPVTPEGSVVIPTVGEFSIAGLSLFDAKELALKEIKKKYLSGIPSFTLLTPRTFTVTLKGAIKQEGTFYVQSTQRVSALVNFVDPTRAVDSTVAQRNIIIRRKNGLHIIADLEKYYATQNTSYNPLLNDGDVVVVPYKNIERNFFGVYGAVNKPGAYEYVVGDSLTTALRIARGFTAIADSEKILIYRFLSETTQTAIEVNLKKIRSGEANDIVLERGDRIVVYAFDEQHRNYTVTIGGEIRFPGTYPITKNATSLSEIIRSAGGITEFASLRNSQLFRRSVNASDIEVERLESARGGITPEDSAYYYLETDIRINRELVVSDFRELIRNNNKEKDIILRDGDYINIATRKNTIYVFGQVVNPGHILFESGRDYRYYIQKAGGVTEYAREGDIKIIKASTRQWLDPSETVIEEGDYVWIPKEPYRPFSYYLTVYSQVFGIIGTVVSLALLVTR